MRETRIKFMLLVAGVTTLIGLLLWQEKIIANLRSQNQSLATQVATSEPSRTEPRVADAQSSQAAADRAELERLRAQSQSMRTQLQQAQTERAAMTRSGAASPATTSRGSVPAGYVSVLDTQDVGAASSEAIFQTFIWAMRTADTNRMAQLLDISAEGAREGLEKMLSKLPEAVARGEMEREAANAGFRFIRELPLPDGDTAVVMEMIEGSREPHRMAMRVRRAGNEWRIVAGKHGPEEVNLDPEQLK